MKLLLCIWFLTIITFYVTAQVPPYQHTLYTTQSVAQVDAHVAGLVATPTNVVQQATPGLTYFVRTDGSDSNTGTNNSAGGAFKTIQKAVSTVANFWFAPSSSNIIQIVDGTYNENVVLPPVAGNGLYYILGNAVTPANVLLAPSSGDGISSSGSVSGWNVLNFKIWATNGNSIIVSQGASITVGTGMNFGPAKSGGVHLFANNNSSINVSGNYTISGGTGNHYYATRGSVINDSVSPTVTITGTPAFTAFAAADDAGVVAMFNVTFSGSATGSRYTMNLNGVIHTLTGSATYFPGNAAGTTNNGGQYQ